MDRIQSITLFQELNCTKKKGCITQTIANYNNYSDVNTIFCVSNIFLQFFRVFDRLQIRSLFLFTEKCIKLNNIFNEFF